MRRRKDDWRECLGAVVRRYESEPFEWGRTDCAHFARDCVRAICGLDILKIGRFGFDGNYDSRLAMAITLRHNGYKSIGAALAASMEAHGFEEIPPRFAIEGDLGITADEVIAVRFAQGFLARDERGRFFTTPVSKSWRVD